MRVMHELVIEQPEKLFGESHLKVIILKLLLLLKVLFD